MTGQKCETAPCIGKVNYDRLRSEETQQVRRPPQKLRANYQTWEYTSTRAHVLCAQELHSRTATNAKPVRAVQNGSFCSSDEVFLFYGNHTCVLKLHIVTKRNEDNA
jgi:hypothetical protein